MKRLNVFVWQKCFFLEFTGCSVCQQNTLHVCCYTVRGSAGFSQHCLRQQIMLTTGSPFIFLPCNPRCRANEALSIDLPHYPEEPKEKALELLPAASPWFRINSITSLSSPHVRSSHAFSSPLWSLIHKQTVCQYARGANRHFRLFTVQQQAVMDPAGDLPLHN